MTTLSPIFNAHGREPAEDAAMWEYLLVPLQEVKGHEPWAPDQLNELGMQGWEAIGLSLKYDDLVVWPVVLLKRPLH